MLYNCLKQKKKPYRARFKKSPFTPIIFHTHYKKARLAGRYNAIIQIYVCASVCVCVCILCVCDNGAMPNVPRKKKVQALCFFVFFIRNAIAYYIYIVELYVRGLCRASVNGESKKKKQKQSPNEECEIISRETWRGSIVAPPEILDTPTTRIQ